MYIWFIVLVGLKLGLAYKGLEMVILLIKDIVTLVIYSLKSNKYMPVSSTPIYEFDQGTGRWSKLKSFKITTTPMVLVTIPSVLYKTLAIKVRHLLYVGRFHKKNNTTLSTSKSGLPLAGVLATLIMKPKATLSSNLSTKKK